MRAIVMLTLLACDAGAPTPPQAPAELLDLPFVMLQRTPCYGTCPHYTLAVQRSGLVRYEGERFVKTNGAAQWRITAAQVEALDELFRTRGYATMADEYLHESVTDSPTITTAYQGPDRQAWKRVVHYRGDMNAPGGLLEIENGIDEIVNIEAWIGTRDERRNMR